MYTPSKDLLDKYAKVLINFALNSGEGVRPGEVVMVNVPESAKPMYVPLRDAVLAGGGYPLMQFQPDDVDMVGYYEKASDAQITFFPATYYRGIVDQVSHTVSIIAEHDKYELSGVEPSKIMKRSNAFKPYMEWRDEKEAAGKFTWTLGMYGTEAMATDVGMTCEEYWNEIAIACYLDQPDPVKAWQKLFHELETLRTKLNSLEIDSVHVAAKGVDGLPDTDLVVGIGENRHWLGGSGRNIPSYELFISPDARRTEGTIGFNEPLYRYGNRISGIWLRFEKGIIVEAHATENEALLKEMIASPNANRIGEFSLTDGAHSRITKPMGETLFDENMGGPQGNTHIAVGNAYKDSFPGDASTITKPEWEAMGYNDSPVHTDIISTAKRTVTATLKDGTKKIIYDNGHFTL